MHVDDIRTFIAVAEAGSISAAEHELHLTQPAVSRRVQRLEDEPGARLIDRRKRPFALTDAIGVAVERCRRLLASADDLKVLVDGAPPSRELRIGVETYNYELQLRLIARGRGLGLVPGRLVLRSPTRRKVRVLRVKELRFPQRI